MKLVLAILVFKIIKNFTSKAGEIALKICPKLLKEVGMPSYVIAVTGSNGKSSTVEMINKVLTKAGLKVGVNKNGSSLNDIVTFVLNDCTLDGKYQNDALLIDTDENDAKYLFNRFTPTHYIITNISRNQMTSDGNPDYVMKQIKKSINPKTTLILNADDPYVACLDSNEMDSHYFGINDSFYAIKENDFVYDDCYYCPRCKSKLIYTYHQFGQIGKYHCSKCKFERKKPEFYISNMDIDNGYLKINGKYEIKLGFNSISNAYNILAAYSVCSLIGVNSKVIVESLNEYFDKNGSIKNFKLGLNRGILLTSKYENPVSFNQNIDYIIRSEDDCTVVIMVNEINKNHFTIDTSWLWDINFDWLNTKNVKEIIVTGLYTSDIAIRLSYADIDMSKVYVNANIHEAIEHTKEHERFIYCLTSHSNEDSFIKEVNAVW